MTNYYFFTDLSTNISNYCMCNIKHYPKLSRYDKKMVFIDPSVYELKENEEYSCIEQLHSLLLKNELKTNEYISIDYPCDMIPIIENREDKQYLMKCNQFIEKSIKNNLKYIENEKYICAIQCKFQDYEDFIEQFNFLYHKIDSDRKIVGLGNLGRIMNPNQYTDRVFNYISEYSGKWLHLYGLSLKCICKYLPKLTNWDNVSVDSTKWTHRVNKNGVLAKSICCRKETRDDYFLEYVRVIQERTGLKINY